MDSNLVIETNKVKSSIKAECSLHLRIFAWWIPTVAVLGACYVPVILPWTSYSASIYLFLAIWVVSHRRLPTVLRLPLDYVKTHQLPSIIASAFSIPSKATVTIAPPSELTTEEDRNDFEKILVKTRWRYLWRKTWVCWLWYWAEWWCIWRGEIWEFEVLRGRNSSS